MAQPLAGVAGRALVLLQPNVDTDVIIRIERLMEVRVDPSARDQLGRWAFESIRYASNGTLRTDCPLNDPARQGAPILVAGPNFGCGSSREGAVWALASLGIRCVIAESFGDIFHANCFQNAMLPVVLPGSEVAALAERAQAGGTLHVDLEREVVTVHGLPDIRFAIDPGRRTGLLLGLDEVGQSLLHADAIAQWQSRDQAQRPWVWTARTQAGSDGKTWGIHP